LQPAAHAARVEAPVRWQHPDPGLLGPETFVPLAERTGLIRRLADWAVAAAVRQSASWLAVGQGMPIAVNLSVAGLQRARIRARNGQVEDAQTLKLLTAMRRGEAQGCSVCADRCRRVSSVRGWTANSSHAPIWSM
jgi:hypothetical protein